MKLVTMKPSAKTALQLLLLCALLATASCRTYEIRQGNVMKDEAIWTVQKGDSKFRVESMLGTPAMTDPLHPNRVQYVEYHRNSETEPDKLRVVEITYDDALRVENIEYYGFDTGAKR